MQYTKWLWWMVLGFLLAIFFVPFIIADGQIFPNLFFPYITGKNFAFRILVELCLGAYILLALREPKYRPRTSVLLWTALAFVGWGALAVLTSIDPTKSFWSNFERMDGYVTLIHLCAYFIIVGAVVTAENWWNKFLQVSLVASTLMALYGLLQRVGVIAISTQSGPRVDGSFGNATYLAVYLLFGIFIALFLLARYWRAPAARWACGAAILLQAAALYFTETRGAILGLVGGLVVAAAIIAWRAAAPEWRRVRRASWWALGAVALVVAVFLAVRQIPAVHEQGGALGRLASISITDRTAQSRFLIWHMALQGAEQKPVFGWGQENFSYVFNAYYVPQMYDQESWFDRAHNQFLDWLVDGGVPMLLLYIALFGAAAWLILRSESLSILERAILLGLLAAYAFNNLFVFDNLSSALYFWLALAFAHSVAQKKPPALIAWSRPLSDEAVAIAAPVVIVVMCVGLWALNVPGLARAHALVGALTPAELVPKNGGGFAAQPKDPKKNLAEFQDALYNLPWPGTALGRQEAVEQLFQFSSNSIAPSTSADPSVKQQDYQVTHAAGVALLQSRPHDARLELFFGVFLNAFGQYQEALRYLDAALADSPQKQGILVQRGITYLSAGDPAGANASFKKALDEAPDYNDARILYAIGLYEAGQNAAADALLTSKFGTTVVDDSRLLGVYSDLKLYDRVAGIWKLRVANDPNNAQQHIGLAAAYFALGDKAGAISELQRAAQLDPSLAAQIQSVIAQIRNGTLKLQ